MQSAKLLSAPSVCHCEGAKRLRQSIAVRERGYEHGLRRRFVYLHRLPRFLLAALATVLTVATLVFVVGCSESNPSAGGGGSNTSIGGTGGATDTGGNAGNAGNAGTGDSSSDGAPRVKITMEDGGVILLELDPQAAPQTVENFVALVSDGFYDGLTFHRIIPNFMIQGGDPLGTGSGSSDQTIVGEFANNGINNPISHTRGVISMARSKANDSASCQFFITNADVTRLDGDYAAFGHVLEGMDVVDRISAVETDRNDRPLTPVVIRSIELVE